MCNEYNCKRVHSKNQTLIYCLQGAGSIPITVKSYADKDFLMGPPLGKKIYIYILLYFIFKKLTVIKWVHLWTKGEQRM